LNFFLSNIYLFYCSLLGHNGAGKSTTISLLTGLLKKDKGTVEMCGYNIDNGLDEAR